MQEITSIAVCGVGSGLERIADAIREAGRWSLVPIEWPDAAALVAARHTVRAYVVCADGLAAPSELVDVLRGRSDQTPLLVIGSEPLRRAEPDLWLPTLTKPHVLTSILSQLLVREDSGPVGLAPSWRRKTDMIIGNSAETQQLLHSLDQLAPAQTPVLVSGESGVGKELVARALHFCGPRATEPFIAINCAAIPETLFEAELFGYQRGAFTGAINAHAGAFEAAHKGTLFLDEIGELPLGMQAKLLRVLETSEVQRIGSTEHCKVNFRLVTATNRMLETEVKAGRFREDLYYRILVYPLRIAPLRDRREDIPPIVTHHLSVIAARENRATLRMTPAALEKMLSYAWPGNVRELVNLLERAVLMSANRVIDAEHVIFPRASSSGEEAPSGALLPYREAKQKFELEYYSQLIRTAGGNVSLAAKLGKKTRKEIYDALGRLGLQATAYRDGGD
ncbi:MAG: sigma-54-dependent Fis family transcriptional regulator [Myxococcales bacterium]|nr:sigma-54-dependent Fis family transcriptional regulator [Myxococcales bacterium]